MTGDLQGGVALVTGAGRGIGRETAIALAAAGARVALIARTESEIVEVANIIQARGGSAAAVPADLVDADQTRAALAIAVAQLGEIEILINNAAVVWPLGPTRLLGAADINKALAINVGAVVALTSLVLPGMLAGGWGRIVNVASGIAAHPESIIGATVYAACKAALEAHTINLAAELEGTGVTVNAYRPGAVDTAMQGWIRQQSPEAVGRALHGRFLAMYASGGLLAPERSATGLIERLPQSTTGEIWDVHDPPPNQPSGAEEGPGQREDLR